MRLRQTIIGCALLLTVSGSTYAQTGNEPPLCVETYGRAAGAFMQLRQYEDATYEKAREAIFTDQFLAGFGVDDPVLKMYQRILEWAYDRNVEATDEAKQKAIEDFLIEVLEKTC
jgi:hypothetical protein